MDSFPGESSGWVINSAVIPKLWMFGRKVPNLFRGLREDFLEAVRRNAYYMSPRRHRKDK